MRFVAHHNEWVLWASKDSSLFDHVFPVNVVQSRKHESNTCHFISDTCSFITNTWLFTVSLCAGRLHVGKI